MAREGAGAGIQGSPGISPAKYRRGVGLDPGPASDQVEGASGKGPGGVLCNVNRYRYIIIAFNQHLLYWVHTKFR